MNLGRWLHKTQIAGHSEIIGNKQPYDFRVTWALMILAKILFRAKNNAL